MGRRTKEQSPISHRTARRRDNPLYDSQSSTAAESALLYGKGDVSPHMVAADAAVH